MKQPEEPLSEEELASLALAADPDGPVAADAIPLEEFLGSTDTSSSDQLLPDWYMPGPATRHLRGWPRRVAIMIIVSLVGIAAYGLCSAYGILGLG